MKIFPRLVAPRLLVSTLLAALGLSGGLCLAGEVSIAVASNFAAPMKKIAEAFARDTGHQTVLALGSTGKLYAQIKNGAPFQVLLAADEATPARLEREGLALASSRFTYAIGRLVLWSKQPGLVDDQGEVLRTGRFSHIAMANPKLAPYGAAATQTMDKLGLLPSLKTRIVQGESIAQTHQFIATENAALGFVALSQVMVDARISQGSAWLVPNHLYTPLRQDGVLLNAGRDKAAALAFTAYLQGEKARAIIRSHGYASPHD